MDEMLKTVKKNNTEGDICMNNSKICIEYNDGKIFINGEQHDFHKSFSFNNIDEEICKKAVVAIINHFNFEPQFMCEEIAQTLENQLDNEDDDISKKQNAIEAALQKMDNFDINSLPLLNKGGKL